MSFKNSRPVRILLDDKKKSSENDFLAELVELAFSQLPAALLANISISFLLAASLWLYARTYSLLIGWLALIWLISLLRYVLLSYYRREKDKFIRPQYWRNLFNLGVFTAGTAWGSAGVIFFQESHPQLNVLIGFALGGLVSGAVTSMAPLKNTTRIYDFLLLTPIIVKFLLSGQNIHAAMAFMGIVYWGICLAMSSTSHDQLLTYLRLRRENVNEINERRKAEEELRQHKDQLEKIVEERTAELTQMNQDLHLEIAERRHAEEKLHASEERHRNMVEAISDWIWEINEQGCFTYSSPRVETLLGYSPEEVLDKTIFDFMPEEEAARLKKDFSEIAARKKPFSGWENTRRRKDGSLATVETNGEPIIDQTGKLLGYRGIDRDITERKHIEQELLRVKNLEALGTLAGGIAHDFNNLLVSVFGNIELARFDMSPDSESYELLGFADEAIEHAKKLTSYLLTFSRGDVLFKESISVRDLLSETCRLVLSGSSVKCNLHIPGDLWPVEIDKGQIWRVFQNLLVNACEAMPDGGVVHLTAENCSVDSLNQLPLAQGKFVKITVTDEGVGIAAEHLPSVFNPYYTTKARGIQKGVGLGLSICHSIIQKHNGYISISSEPGRGTTVVFYLPASANESTEPIEEKKEEKKISSVKKRILMMEDEESVISVTCGMFNRLGYEYEIARQSQEAIDLYCQARERGKPFDLVILDLTIRGGMGGKETIVRLLEIDPAVNALVASGYADDRILSNYEDYGFKGAIAKPFRLSTLKNAIEKTVK